MHWTISYVRIWSDLRRSVHIGACDITGGEFPLEGSSSNANLVGKKHTISGIFCGLERSNAIQLLDLAGRECKAMQGMVLLLEAKMVTG